MHIPSHQAIRFFLLSFTTGLIVLMVGLLIVVTLPKHTGKTTNTNSSTQLSSNDLSQSSVHVHGVVTAIGDHVITISTEGVIDIRLPASVVIHYSDNTLQSVDTSAAPDPVSGKTAEAHTIDATELRVGDNVDVIATKVSKDATDIDAESVLQIL